MSNTTTTSALRVAQFVPTSEDGLTPYAAAKAVNAALEALGHASRIPTQMMYNYTTARLNAKKSPFVPVKDNGRIDPVGLVEWMVKYLSKKGYEVTK